MVALRKACAYSKKYTRPYTRISKKKSKSFIKTVPQIKIPKFTAGIKAKAGNFEYTISLVSTEKIQARDNALEASRQYVTRELDKLIPGQFYLQLSVYLHHILRENKMLTGAGSDRMQTGMQRSFGKTIGRAALIKPGQRIFTAMASGDKSIRIIRAAFNAVKSKLPGRTTITLVKNQ